MDDEEELDEDEDEDEYGMEDDYGEEDEEEEEESQSHKKGGKPKQKSIYADYEEFAHLLEDGLYDGEENKSKKFLPRIAGTKRPNHRRNN